ncbi:hypothetical protein SLE2022_248460 [Rubroshorea leprosula]
MFLRCRNLKKVPSFLPHISSGYHCHHQCRQAINLVASSLISLHPVSDEINRGFSERFCLPGWYSTICLDPPAETNVVSFIEHAVDQLQGPHHCWVNRDEGNNNNVKKGGAFLVLVGRFHDNSEIAGCDPVTFEKVKSLQQRFPQLHVMGFQGCSSVCSSNRTQLLQLIMKEYITFPILFSNKNFSEMANGTQYILFKDFKNPVVYDDKDADLGTICKAIEEISVGSNENSSMNDKFKSTWSKQADIIKGPHFCSSLQNLLLYFPGCISADESGNRLFLSDSNHHRIIILNSNGRILDCIGSCPGFEDGEFESCKLSRPAASFYDADEDHLYLVDSENHAIRRADLETRVLETVYPTSSVKKNNSLWTWIVNKFGFQSDAKSKAERFDLQVQSLMFPWHLMKSDVENFLVIDRSFETLWILDLASGEIQEVAKGFSKILDICGDLILDKLSLLKQMPHDFLKQQTDAYCSLEGLISCITTCQNYLIMCDMVGQGVLKLSKESRICSNIQFSNFGILGLPYWLSFPLERFYADAAGLPGGQTDHLQCLSLLPGRVDIRLYVDIPPDTEVVESLQESCIWLQARGAANEVSGVEHAAGSSEKVGVAQQWYDELDNLAFSTAESELNVEDEDTTSDMKTQDGRIRIDCAVNTSPGTSEVIVYAALYLRLKRNPDSQEDNPEKYAARIADILTGRNGGMRRDSCFQFLSKSKRDLRDLIFLKPLHVRIKFESPDHPKADHSKSVILTDSSVDVNVSLNA